MKHTLRFLGAVSAILLWYALTVAVSVSFLNPSLPGQWVLCFIPVPMILTMLVGLVVAGVSWLWEVTR